MRVPPVNSKEFAISCAPGNAMAARRTLAQSGFTVLDDGVAPNERTKSPVALLVRTAVQRRQRNLEQLSSERRNQLVEQLEDVLETEAS